MNEPVAIVGIGCRLPGGADSPAEFWNLLCAGTDAIRQLPPERFDVDEIYDPDPSMPGKIYTRWGGFIDGIDEFDADFFGISPREARRMDPQHRLLLETAWEALEDGGIVPERIAGSRTGVFIGISTHDYADMHVRPGHRKLLDAHINIGNALCAAPNRISYFLDLHGPSFAIESACSSSLTAVHLACRSLQLGESEMALAGGVNLVLSPELTIGFCKASMMSPGGRCRAFDAAADGYVRSEGAGVVVLKTLRQAMKDGDPVHAVIRATAINEDGRTAGISLPNGDAQEQLLLRTLAEANIPPSAVQYVEAHGTGTAAGDPIEAGAIGRVFGAGRSLEDPCLIGSAKTNVGHLEAGSGITGLIKAALCLRHRQVPPSLHFNEPNPAIPFGDLRLRMPTSLEPWPETRGPAMAAVNSFGFGGSNAHAILEEPPPPAANGSAPRREAHLLALSARTPEALRDYAERFAEHLPQSAASLEDVCFTASRRRTHHEHRLAVVGKDTADLTEHLHAFLQDEASADVSTARMSREEEPKIAFAFSGMGPQWWGMGRSLLEDEPVYRQKLEECDGLLRPIAGWSLLDELRKDEATSRIAEADFAHVANCAMQVSLAALWRSWGIVPDAVTGHSSGEIAAAHGAGALDLHDALFLAYHRGRLQHTLAGTGGMLAAAMSADEATSVLEPYQGQVSLAAVNSPDSVTLSGDAASLQQIAETLEARGVFHRLLRVEVPYHAPQMASIRDELVRVLEPLSPRPASLPMVSTTTGEWIDGAELVGDHWWRNVRDPVQFAPAVDRLLDEGYEIILEVGPHPVLASYLTECVDSRDAPTEILATLRRTEDDRSMMLQTLGALHVRGRRIDWSGVYPGGACVPLPRYPWQHERYWFETPDIEPEAKPAGVDTGHPLLGRRLASPQPVWEVNLNDSRAAYLDEHLVEESVVFPGAGYVEMMVAAARQLSQDDPVSLQQIDFRKLLFLGDSRNTILQLHYGRDGAMEIHAAPKDTAAIWTLHATAGITRMDHGHEQRPLDLQAVRERCPREMPVDEHFRSLETFGFRYGDTFRGVREIRLGDGEALGRIGWPDRALTGGVADYHVHPALLDAAFQVLAIAAASAGQRAAPEGALFPVAVDRVLYHRAPGASFFAHAVVHDLDAANMNGDILLVDAEGNVSVSFVGLRLKILDEGRAENRPEAVDWLYELRWQESPLNAANAPSDERLNGPGDAKKAVEAAVSAPEEDPLVAMYYTTVEPALNRAARSFVFGALRELGWTSGDSSHRSAESLAADLGVVPGYCRLLGTLVDMPGNGAATTADNPDRTSVEGDSPHRVLDALETEAPQYAAEAQLLRRGGQRLAAILRGDLDVREVLLSEEALALLSRMYHSSPGCRSYHELVAETVAATIPRDVGRKPLRVLEIGAGTGAATTGILARLPPTAEYVFTDVSPYFVAQARQHMDGHFGLRFSVLDIEQDPVAQGFSEHSFDIVVAANVLHATADIRTSLAHVRGLLAPGGSLILLELTRRADWLNLVFGLLDGWWRFTDSDIRPDHPLLEAAQWRDLLRRSGFEDAMSRFDDDPRNRLQTVISARRQAADHPGPTHDERSTYLILGDADGVGTRVAEHMQARGHHCIIAGAAPRFDRDPEGVFEVPPDDAAQMAQLLDEIRTDGIDINAVIHLWSLDPVLDREATADQMMEAQRFGCESVLSLVQALQETEHRPPEIWLVTSGAQSVDGEGAAHVEQSTLWGLGRVLMNEHMDARCRLVDLSPEPSTEDVRALVDEVVEARPDDEVAFRGRSRFVRRVARASLDQLPKHERRGQLSPDSDAFRLEIGTPGALDSLTLREAREVTPGPGELTVRVRASGINFREVLHALDVLPEDARGDQANGMGVECAGVVVAIGEGVDGFDVGDEVIALAAPAHASHAIARAHLAVQKPGHVSFAMAATVVNGFVTADYALSHIARLEPGERVLIHSATGAVGLAAIQLCRAVGAEIFATAGNPEKRAYLTNMGVKHVMDSRSLAFFDEVMRDTDGEGVDVVVNSLTGEAMQKSLNLLRPYGRFIELGKRDIYENAHIGLHPFRNNLSYFAVDLMRLAVDRPELANRLLRRAVDRVADGTWTAVPHTAFDMADAEQAFRLIAQARHIGKVVLTVDKPGYDVLLRDRPLCRPDATYLITGGLGGFGLATASWLVRGGARHLVLVSRSGLPKDDPGLLEELNDSPANVVVMRADVVSEEDVARVLEFVRREMPPLGGLVHAAMVLDDDVLARLDRVQFRKVLEPKLAGAWNLHRQTRHDELDFFVLFSSIASVMGHPMQGNYAAANAFLDALPGYRRVRGLPGLAIGWGAVSGVGYVARHNDVSDYLDHSGFIAFPPDEAVDALGELLRYDAEHLVAARVDWRQWADFNPVTAASPRFLALTPTSADDPDAAPAPDPGAPIGLLRNAPAEERLDRVEEYLVNKVAKVLGSTPQKVDPQRPLTELGFDSLMAVELINALKVDLGVKLPVVKILQGTSSRALSATLVDRLFSDAPAPAPAPRSRAQGEQVFPLSFEQRRFWLLDRMEPGNPAYNLPASARLEGQLDVPSLSRSVSEVVSRHEVLRAAIREVNGEPVQVYAPPEPIELPVEDLRSLPAAQREEDLRRRMTEEMQQPFDLSTPPLLRAKLFRLDEEEHVFLLAVHHAACDGGSMNLLVREITSLYDAFSQGRPSSLAAPPSRYVDYVYRQRERSGNGSDSAEIAYWEKQLRDAPVSLDLPDLRASESAARGGHVRLELSRASTSGLHSLAAAEGATLFMALTAAFQALLHRYSGNEDISVGTAVSKREEAGAEAVAGCFMNTVVLRTDLSGEPTFRDLLGRVREVALGAFEHSNVPFERVVEALRPRRGAGRLPLFEAMLVLHSARLPALRLNTIHLTPVEVETDAAVADLVLVADPGERLSLTLEYSTEVLDADSASRLLGHLRVLLETIVENADRPISSLPIMTAVERQTVLTASTAAATAFADHRLHELLEEQAARSPDAVAVVQDDEVVSYRELDRQACRFARCLAGLQPDDVVGLYASSSPARVAALLGILKAGGAFLPLDPADPLERSRFMIRNAGARVVVTERRLSESLRDCGARLLVIEEIGREGEDEERGEEPLRRSSPDDLAYVIYTSGSTGEPKGVMIPHRGICNQVQARQKLYPLLPEDGVLQRTPPGFDPSIWEIFGPLAAGARVVLPGRRETVDAAGLIRSIVDHGVTTLQIVPSYLAVLLEEPDVDQCACLERVFCGGEALTASLRDRFFERLPSVQLINMYGPAEAAIDTASFECRNDDAAAVPIGWPVPNVQMYVLDRHQQQLPMGLPGEIYIGGPGLARGYVNDPVLTAEQFVPHRSTSSPDDRLYRTGDLGRRRADGAIEFLGRSDDQIKVRGHRVEPGEVAAVLMRHPGVREVTVAVVDGAAGDPQLLAAVVPENSEAHGEDEMVAWLRSQLPLYMLPSRLALVSVLPRLEAGKIDRHALAAIAQREGSRERPYVAPRDVLELQLVQLWEELLDIRPISIRDEFFDLGGHSLLAMRLVSRVRQQFAREMSPADLVREPTIERLARLLRRQYVPPPSPVVAIQPLGALPPVFFVHPTSGSVLCYTALARTMGYDRPFYGIQSPALEGETARPRLEQMASDYAKAVRAVQAHGPYYLGGWSMGAVIAYEMAGQLEAQGQEVAMLALLDPPPSPLPAGDDDEIARIKQFAESIGVPADKAARASDDARRTEPAAVLGRVLKLARQTDLVPDDLEPGHLRWQMDVHEANMDALRAYTPRPYSGKMALLSTASAAAGADAWKRLAAGDATRIAVPGDHASMLRDPDVHVLGQHLKAVLDRTQSSQLA